jgi:hypothetical protein
MNTVRSIPPHKQLGNIAVVCYETDDAGEDVITVLDNKNKIRVDSKKAI